MRDCVGGVTLVLTGAGTQSGMLKIKGHALELNGSGFGFGLV